MSGWNEANARYRCEAVTRRRGLQCQRQAMHYDAEADMYHCQQHWELWMTEQGFDLS